MDKQLINFLEELNKTWLTVVFQTEVLTCIRLSEEPNEVAAAKCSKTISEARTKINQITERLNNEFHYQPEHQAAPFPESLRLQAD